MSGKTTATFAHCSSSSYQPHEKHWTPIEKALTPQEVRDFTWKRSYGEIQTYEHDRTHGRIHTDPQGQFYDRHAQPITKERRWTMHSASRIITRTVGPITSSAYPSVKTKVTIMDAESRSKLQLINPHFF